MDIPKILIVEDDADLSEMLCAFFGVQDYEVRAAAWGQEALKMSLEENLSLIMLDIRLPDMDGYEVCRQIRQNRHTQDIPIIFLTEKRSRVDKLQGLELGVVDYVTKPFDVQELRLRVRNAIQRAAQPSLLNPVTELPDAPLLDEQLSAIVQNQRPWSLILLSLLGLDKLRAHYGFVAADEMLRAVALLTRGVVREHGNEGDFVAHFGAQELIIITTPDRTEAIRERLETRLRQSLAHFYRPTAEESDEEVDFLDLKTAVLQQGDEPYDSVEDLRAKLAETLKLPAPQTTSTDSD